MTKRYYRYDPDTGKKEWSEEVDFAPIEDVTDALEKKADKTELFSGSYDDLTNKPSIPSASDVAKGVTAHSWGDHSVAGYAKTKADVGLGNVDDTSDANKPISTATQAALDTKVNTDDSRLANSREWTASTVSQAEAEAGTATTRRAWTAQRVRQAIVAWFNGVSGTIGRTILGRNTAAQVRGDLGLGSAATRDVGTASDNVMAVGAFGLGVEHKHLDEFSANTPNGFYRLHATSTNPPSGVALPAGGVVSGADGGPSNTGLFVSRNGDLNILVHRGGQVYGYSGHHTGNILKTTGNNDNYPMSQKAVTDALNSAPGLGVGQTWRNVKSSRVKGTTYTNTTGKPIYVAIITYGETWAKGDLFVDDVRVDYANLDFSGDDVYLGFSAIVPAGSTYMFETWDSYISVFAWNELR